MPRVFNKHIDVVPAGAVYVGRPSKWGNPMTVEEVMQLFPGITRREAQERAVIWYSSYLSADLKKRGSGSLISMAKRELKGRYLVCWCHPLPCHGHVLLVVANTGWDEGGG